MKLSLPEAIGKWGTRPGGSRLWTELFSDKSSKLQRYDGRRWQEPRDFITHYFIKPGGQGAQICCTDLLHSAHFRLSGDPTTQKRKLVRSWRVSDSVRRKCCSVALCDIKFQINPSVLWRLTLANGSYYSGSNSSISRRSKPMITLPKRCGCGND